MAAKARPRFQPHLIEDSEPVDSKPSSRGAPKWADDPDEINAELAAMDQRDAERRERSRAIAHTRAHQENIRRDRVAKRRATTENARREKAAADAAAARRPAAVLGRTSKRAGAFSSAIPRGTGGGLTVTDASGFVLALLGWSWVALPLLTGGPAAMRNVWRAKFFNKDSKGNPIP